MNKIKIETYLLENNFVSSIEEAKKVLKFKLVYLKDKLLKVDAFINQEDFKDIRILQKKYVSRGYSKLESVFDKIHIDVNDLVCLDIGSSTGGFTELLLKKNAAKVFAVDVGKNLLDDKLRKNPKVKVYEGLNARNIAAYANFIKDIDFCTMDISFISIKKIVPHLIALLKPKAYFIPLIKPQFECSKNKVKEGVVKDIYVIDALKEDINNFLNQNFDIMDIIDSKLKGPKGNQEFFFVCRKKI